MTDTATYVLVGVAALAVLAGIAAWFSRSLALGRLKEVEAQLVAAESRLSQAQTRASAQNVAQVHTHAQGRKALAHAREASVGAKASRRDRASDSAETRQAELLALRRDVAHARDEARKAKDELRGKETELRESREKAAVQMHAMREDVRRLVEQLREAEGGRKKPVASNGEQTAASGRNAEPADATAIDETKKQLAEAKHQIAQLKAKMVANERAERTLGEAEERARVAQNKLSEIERELRRYRDAATPDGGKPMDPVLFLRWKERAMEGRRMYQMMRGLRELSDRKLVSYQEGLVRVCSEVLNARGVALPAAGAAGAPADVYLATTLAAIGVLPSGNETARMASSQKNVAGTAGPLSETGAAYVSGDPEDEAGAPVRAAASEDHHPQSTAT